MALTIGPPRSSGGAPGIGGSCGAPITIGESRGGALVVGMLPPEVLPGNDGIFVGVWPGEVVGS